MLRIRLGITLHTLVANMLFAIFSATFLPAADFTIPTGYIFEVNDNTLEMPDEDINNTGSVTLHYGTITLGGDWLNSGYFSSSYGTVELNNSSQAQSVTTDGTSSAFSTIKITNTTSNGVTFADALYCGTLTASSGVQKLSFGTSGVHTISSNFNVNGSSGNLITLAPAEASTNWYLDAPSTTVNYLDVSYSHEASGKTIVARNSINGGNNENWIFSPDVITGTATNIGSSTATLNGTVNANGTSTTAWFDYGTVSGVYTSSSTTQTVNGTSSTTVSIGVSGLSANTTYYYRIAAQNSVGTTYGSERFFVTIDPQGAIRQGFADNVLSRNDDSSTSLVSLGFTINFFGNSRSGLYINNNGNVTFDSSMSDYTPFNLSTTTRKIIAPFFADVDTSASGSTEVTYSFGTGTVNGRNAFGVNWINVGYYDNHVDKLNGFQLVLIDRSDIASGDFDMEFNYGKIQWETGDASGGSNGLGGTSARAGYTNGSGMVFELSGSGVNGALLDTNATTGLVNNAYNSSVVGRYVFEVRGGSLSISSGNAPPTVTTGSATSTGTSIATLNGVVSANGTATTAWFEYGTNPLSYSNTTSTQSVSGTSSTSVSINLSSLSPNTTYYYRIAGQNSVGTSYGSEASFTTLSDTTAPSGSVNINNGSVYTNSSNVTLSLTAADDAGITGFYASELSTIPVAGDPVWTAVTSTTSYSANASYTLSTGDGTKTVYVWYKDGTGNVSSTASDAILLDTDIPAISIIDPTSNTTYTTPSSTISLSGTASDSGSGISSVTWSNSRGGSGAASGTTSWSVSSIALLSGSNVITVTATDGAGNTATDTITVTYSLPTVTTGSATSMTLSTAILTGTAIANGTITAWFEYGISSGSYGNTTSSQNISGTTTTGISACISNLTPWTTYYYRIAAQNDAGTSYGSETTFMPRTQISAGDEHTLISKADGTVWAWGANWIGQLGSETTDYNPSSTPIKVDSMSGVITVAGGYGHSLALKSNGTVWAWGGNWYGELGNGTTTSSSTPVQVSGLSSAVAIAGGQNHSLALKSDGTVWSWGYNWGGQLGNGTTTDSSIPVQVNGLNSVTAVAGGVHHSLALKSDGTVWAWGYNGVGELGNGTTTSSSTPVQVSGLSNVIAIACRSQFSLALKSDGTVCAWGYNNYGRGGDGINVGGISSTPVQVSGLSNVIAIACGLYHSLILKSNGTVWALGHNGYGQLGDSSTANSSTPVQVDDLSDVVAIAAGSYHSIAMKSNGDLWGWGLNGLGQLGYEPNGGSSSPVQVVGISSVSDVSGGVFFSLALKSDNTVWAWGDNFYGQLGTDSASIISSPNQISSLTGVTDVTAGSYHSIALKTDGTVWGWGANWYGQLGNGSTTSSSTPVQVSGLSSTTAVAGGAYHSLALKSDGTVWSWGDNWYGELGNGSTTSSNTPVQVSGLSSVTAIAGGAYHSLALKSDGTVWAWGGNWYGELGNGTTTSSNTPVQVSGLNSVTAVAGGTYHSLALKSDGTIWAWGYNGVGELGNGTTTSSNTPVQVGISGTSTVNAISAGDYHSFALKSDSTLWAWGYNWAGQLGNDAQTIEYTPIETNSISGVNAIDGGYDHTLAVKSNGTVWSWGGDMRGQLGVGNTQLYSNTAVTMNFNSNTRSPTITTSSASSVSTNSATLNGTVNANGLSTTAWFQYGASSGSYTGTTTSQSVSGTSTTSLSASISGLSSSTTYYYRIAAQNIAGTSYGNETSFTTSSPSGGGGGGGGSITYISVTSTNPTSEATGVAVNSTISATFSDTMNGSTLTTDSFKLTRGGSTVGGSVSTSGNKATFTPSSNLAYNTTYTATITTDAKAANVSNSALSSNYTWSFTTASPSDTTAPAGGISINNNASYTTTRDITLNLSVTDNTGVTGYSISTNEAVPFATGTSWVSVTPAASFTKDVSYTLSSGDGSKTVYAFYKDAAENISNAASDSIILDMTPPSVMSTIPSSGTTSVAVDITISAVFSEVMDISTIGTSTFFLSGGVAGTITTNTGTATTASFKPSNNLAYNTSYTATVKKGASDLAGNSMASDYTWNFTTGSSTSDITAPIGGITINNDASYTTTRNVTLNLSATDNVGVTGYSLSTSAVVPSAASTSWISVTPSANFTKDVSYTLSSVDGRKMVYAFYKDAAGNVSNVVSYSIILDTTPPSVISTTPSGSATSVAVDTNISAIFSEPMDVSTIGTSTFFVSGGVTGTITTSTGTTTVATCLPSRELAYNTTYTTTITTGTKDKAGNALPAQVMWSFTTTGTMTIPTPIFTPTLTPMASPTPMTSPTYLPLAADFTASPTTGSRPLTVQFTDQSVGDISLWKWNFGDGTTDSVQNPAHTYPNKGEYTVSLTVSGPYGSDTKTVKNCITVTGKKAGALTAGFTAAPTTGEWPLAVQFTDQSLGDISGWKWDFGDGTTDTTRHPSHVYNKSGDFTVSLTVSDKDKSTNTKTIDEYISVSRKKSSLELLLSASEINFGEPLTLRGNISPALQTEITFSFGNKSGGTDTAKITSGTDGNFSLSDYYPPSGGSWDVTAKWEGNEKYQDAESDSREFTVSPIKTGISLEPSSSVIRISETIHITGTITVTPDNETTRDRFLQKELNLFRLTPDGKYEDPLSVRPFLSGDQPGYQWKDINLPDIGTWEVWVGFDTNESFIGTSSAHKEIEVQEAPKDVAGYAILVEGYVENKSGLESHNLTANYIYNKLLERGLTNDGIYYFNYDTAQNGVDEKPSENGVLNAIKTWASGKMNKSPAPLYIIFVGHGEKEKFLLHPDTLDADSLSNALDGKKGLKSQLHTNALNEPIVIIIGANHSGSFIDNLTSEDTSGMKRVVVASCDTEEVAYKGPLPPGETLRHGDYFVYEFMKYAGAGKTLKKSYELAAEKIALYTENEDGNGLNGADAGNGQYFDNAAQHPLLEDNGDGVGIYGMLSSSGGNDGAVAANLVLGFGSSTTLLELTQVSDATTLGTEDSGPTLFAEVNIVTGVDAWTEIISPNHRLQGNKDATEQQVVSLPVFRYNDFSETDKRYTWNDFSSSGILDNFSEPGKYRALYFAQESETGMFASLKTSEIFRNSENNKPPTRFNPIFPVYGTETTVALIFDWEDSLDPDSDGVVTYDLTVSQDENFATIYYQQKGLKNSSAVVDRTASFRDDVKYYWKVLASDTDGGTTAMGTTTASTDSSRILGYLIDDNRDPIASGEISVRRLGTTTENVNMSNEDGFFEFDDLESGKYLLRAEKEYYRKYKDILKLEEGEIKYQEVMLKKLHDVEGGSAHSLLWSDGVSYADGRGGRRNAPGKETAVEGKHKASSFEEQDNQETTVSSSSFKPKLANGYPGFITGFIYDKETNTKLSDATIIVEGAKGSYTTTENGSYFLQLLSGTYEISVDASGYRAAAESIRVDALSTTARNIGLTKAKQTSSISGQVTDTRKGMPLEGVTITVKEKAFKKTTVTDNYGKYSVAELESGKYMVIATKKGYRRYRKNIKLEADQDRTLNIKLGKK